MVGKFFIQEAIKKVKIEEYLEKELNKAGFCGMKIHKTPLATRIIVDVTRPGLAIGKSGKNIAMITEELGEQFKIDNPQLEINEIKVPELNARAMVNRMVALISRGFSWKSVAFRSVEDILNSGAIGVELVLKGKLTGKGGRKMKHRLAKGYMKKAGDLTKLVDYAKDTAYTKAGAIGIKLRLIKPGTIFPDKISIKEVLEKSKGIKTDEKKPEVEVELGDEDTSTEKGIIEMQAHDVIAEQPEVKAEQAQEQAQENKNASNKTGKAAAERIEEIGAKKKVKKISKLGQKSPKKENAKKEVKEGTKKEEPK